MTPTRMRIAGLLGGVVVVSALVVGFTLPGDSEPPEPTIADTALVTTTSSESARAMPAVPAASKPTLAAITRQQVLDRAYEWYDRGIQYSQRKYAKDPDGNLYRQDCSGLVAMALNLDPDEKYWTGNLDSVLEPIAWNDLRPGDIVGDIARPDRKSGHVVIFEKWANKKRTKFVAIDLRNRKRDMVHGTWSVNTTYKKRKYKPYRYPNIVTSAEAAARSGV